MHLIERHVGSIGFEDGMWTRDCSLMEWPPCHPTQKATSTISSGMSLTQGTMDVSPLSKPSSGAGEHLDDRLEASALWDEEPFRV